MKMLIQLMLVLPAGRAFAQCPSWAEGFFPPGVVGTVRALANHDAGFGPRVFVGGSFELVSGQPVTNIASWDGAHWSGVGGGVDNIVRALNVFDDGTSGGPRLFAGGAFGIAGSLPVSNVACWDGSSWSDVGGGFNDNVLAFAAYDDGTGPALYAGGLFTSAGTTPCARIARWNGTSWDPVGGGMNAVIHALCVFDDGAGPTLFAGGEFTMAGGVSTPYIARWNGSSWSGVSSGMNNAVYALEVFQDVGGSRLFAGGNFTVAGGVSANFVGRWDGTNWSSLGFVFPNTVYALEVHDDGGVPALYTGSAVGTQTGASAARIHRYAAGAVTALSDTVGLWTYALLSTPGIAGSPNVLVTGGAYGAFTRIGSTWSTMGPGQLPGVNPREFQEFGGGTLGSRRLFLGGNSVASWDGQQFLPESLPIRPSTVEDMVVYDDGTGERLIVSGHGGLGSWSALQAFDGTSWSIVSWLSAPTLVPYRTLAVQDFGAGSRLFAGGNHPQLQNIAQFDGAVWTGLGSGLNSVVNDLLTRSGPNGPELIAAGYFTASGTLPLPACVARWNGTSWSPVGTVLTNDKVLLLCEYDSGSGPELYASGQRMVGGFPTTFVARWSGTSWIDIATNGPGSSSEITHLLTFDDGSGGGTELYALGWFVTVPGGQLQHVAKWDGARWATVDWGLDNLPLGGAVVRDTDGVEDLWLGGTFRNAGGHSSWTVARLDGCGPVSRFCAGDDLDPHVTTDCPCANFGALGRGCAWHGGPQGALLDGQGVTQPDTLVLEASGMPANGSSTVFLKGDALERAGLVFGDGIRCIGGQLIRLGSKSNVNGTARYPETGDASVSVRGYTPPGSGEVGYYQARYRNAATFCTSATFNATNALRIAW
ncbi:MAG: hypothetical protein HZA53_03685 [Planctomycetes bacterium]|nr:hypothetical protein [Planctomycetota bacterium]